MRREGQNNRGVVIVIIIVILPFTGTFIKSLLDATYLISALHTVSYIISPKIAHDYLPLTGQENGRDLSCIPCKGLAKRRNLNLFQGSTSVTTREKADTRAFQLLFRLSDFLFFLKNKSVHVKVWMFQR